MHSSEMFSVLPPCLFLACYSLLILCAAVQYDFNLEFTKIDQATAD